MAKRCGTEEQRRLGRLTSQNKWAAKNKSKAREYAGRHRIANPDMTLIYSKRWAWAQFGITYEQGVELKKRGCDICGSMEQLELDHDHDTMTFRGVLCHKCNIIVDHHIDPEYVKYLTNPPGITMKNRNVRKIPCFWCEMLTQVSLDATIVICSVCTGQGAKLPDADLRNKAWQGDKPIGDILKTGMTFDI